jgi:hypothetical protein
MAVKDYTLSIHLGTSVPLILNNLNAALTCEFSTVTTAICVCQSGDICSYSQAAFASCSFNPATFSSLAPPILCTPIPFPYTNSPPNAALSATPGNVNALNQIPSLPGANAGLPIRLYHAYPLTPNATAFNTPCTTPTFTPELITLSPLSPGFVSFLSLRLSPSDLYSSQSSAVPDVMLGIAVRTPRAWEKKAIWEI